MSTVGKSFCTHLFTGFLVINTDVLIVMIDIEMWGITAKLLRLRIICVKRGAFMTALRQSAMKELERLPEDKVGFVLQIM